MSAFSKLTKSHQRSSWLYPSRLIMVMIAGLIAWSWLTPLDEVASAMGEVAPQGKVKVIQHLEGGIIRDLFVREGDHVLVNDELMRLELGVDRRNPAELQAELDNLLLGRTPWQAEIKGTALNFDPALAARRPDGVAREIASFKARQAEILSALDVVNKQITQRRLAINTLETRRTATRNDLVLAEENYGIANQAVLQGIAKHL